MSDERRDVDGGRRLRDAGEATRREQAVRDAIRRELSTDAPDHRPRAEEPGPAPGAVLELEHISLSFDRPILDDISFLARAGETVVLVGESGTGKSTVLKLILRLLSPDSGRVYIDGQDISPLSYREALAVRQKMGMVFQGAALFDSMSVFENVAYPLREHTDMSDEEIEARVREKLEFVDLVPEEVMWKLPSALSGGMRKRVGIARGMASNPRIMLYDEPTSGLDPLTTGVITRLIIKLQRELGVTSLVVSHDIRSAFRMASHIALLHERVISFFGTPDEVPLVRRPTFISWEQLRVGLLILIALGLLTVAIIRLGSAANLFTSRYTLYTFVGNANGLRQGGSVMIAGQLAGTVKEIQFLPPDGDTLRNLRIALSLDQELQPQVRADSRAKVRTLGLLGDKVVDISVGTPRYSVLQDADTILTAPTVDYDYVIAQASGAVVDVVQLTSDLRAITGGLARGEGTVGQLLTSRDLYDDFTGTLRQTNQLLTRLQSRDGTLGRLLDDPELYGNMNGAVASLDSLLGQLNSNQGTLGRLIRDDTLYTRLVNVMGGADSLLTLLHSGNGTAAKLLTDQELYDRLNQTLTELNTVLEDVRRNPQKYTKGMIKVF